MTNIEKLYKLAKIEATAIGCTNEDIQSPDYYSNDCEGDCIDCTWYDEDEVYPPFTNTKLLKLESYIFQLNYGYCHLERHLDANFENNKVKNLFFVWMYRIGDIGYYDEETDESYNDFDIECHNADRKQALAGLVCELWEDLTPEQRKEIKRILE